jgi:hypothetical protein
MDDSPIDVDMSPEAIDQRLRELGQLYRLGMSLRKARLLGPLQEVQQRQKAAQKSEEPDVAERSTPAQ